MSAFYERGLCLKTNVPGLMIGNSFSLLESENKTLYMTPTDSDDNIYKGVSQYQSLLLTTVLLKNTPTYGIAGSNITHSCIQTIYGKC